MTPGYLSRATGQMLSPLTQMEEDWGKRSKIGFVKSEMSHPYSDVKEAVGIMNLTSEERSKLKT